MRSTRLKRAQCSGWEEWPWPDTDRKAPITDDEEDEEPADEQRWLCCVVCSEPELGHEHDCANNPRYIYVYVKCVLPCMMHMMTWHCTEMPLCESTRVLAYICLPGPAPRSREELESIRRRASSTCPRDRSFLLPFTQLDAESKTRRLSKAIALLLHERIGYVSVVLT